MISVPARIIIQVIIIDNSVICGQESCAYAVALGLLCGSQSVAMSSFRSRCNASIFSFLFLFRSVGSSNGFLGGGGPAR
jgi:hypothetical protein